MEIKTSLKKLMALFAQAVNDEELPLAERSFAGKTMILVAHTQRIEKKFEAIITAQDKQIAELVSIVALLRQGNAQPPAAPPAPDAETPPALSEDDEAEAMAARVLAETQEEERALAAAQAKGGATVTQLRQPNGEGEQAPTGEAS